MEVKTFEFNDDLIKLVFLYFEYRNLFNQGFQRYYFFKNIIKYITCIQDNSKIRRIFQKLLFMGVFDKGKVYQLTMYHFNPYCKPLPKPSLTVEFD
tara:strand:+ start:3178 stop:3465 length:288 start_codon:yes stop_codon:yes gene_type:complete